MKTLREAVHISIDQITDERKLEVLFQLAEQMRAPALTATELKALDAGVADATAGRVLSLDVLIEKYPVWFGK